MEAALKSEFPQWTFHDGRKKYKLHYGKTEKNGRRPHYRNEKCENDAHAIHNDIDHNG